QDTQRRALVRARSRVQSDAIADRENPVPATIAMLHDWNRPRSMVHTAEMIWPGSCGGPRRYQLGSDLFARSIRLSRICTHRVCGRPLTTNLMRIADLEPSASNC